MKKTSAFGFIFMFLVNLNLLNAAIPLFRAYPQLQTIPYKKLGDLPTPVTHADGIGGMFGIKSLCIKRDDLSGVVEHGKRLPGCLRKLEFHFGQVLVQGADTVVTRGSVNSNHAVAATIYAHRLGLQSILLLSPQDDPVEEIRKKLLLSLCFGAEIYSAGCGRDDLEKPGRAIYDICVGGSDVVGELGFINAVFELKEQIIRGVLPEPDIIYVPMGTGGSALGIYLGVKLAWLKSKVIAVRPKKSVVSYAPAVEWLLENMNKFLSRYGISTYPWIERDFFMKEDIACSDCLLDIERLNDLLQRTEGICLDKKYSGMAFAVLVADAREGFLRDQDVLFWNTTFNTEAFDSLVYGGDFSSLSVDFLPYFVGYDPVTSLHGVFHDSGESAYHDGVFAGIYEDGAPPGCG